MQLLAVNIGIWIGVGAGVVALLFFLAGIFRRFTRCSWISWQIFIVFAVTLLFRFLPSDGSAASAVLPPALLLAAAVLVLAVGGWSRHGMLAYQGRPPLIIRFANRFLGGLTVLLNFVVFLFIVAAPVFVALPLFGVDVSVLDVVYENPFWTEFAGRYALDLLIVALLLLAVRCGYRVGLLRALWALLTVALCVGAVILAAYMARRVPFLADWAASLAGNFESLGAFSSIVGTAIVAAVCFAVLLVVIILISVLMNILMKKIRKPTALRAVDGALLALVFAAIFFLVVYGVDFAVYYIADGAWQSLVPGMEDGAAQGTVESVRAVAQMIETFFRTEPLSESLYDGNPFLLLLG